MSLSSRCSALIALLLVFSSTASAAVFQFVVPAESAKGKRCDAFLWLPPQSPRVRGVVMAGMTLMERQFVEDPIIRKACAEQQLAIVFLKCGLGSVNVQKVLNDLAAASGYAELSGAPLLFVGHSAGGPQAKALAIKMPDRCIGLVQYRGGIPGAGKDDAGQLVPPGVPTLMMLGQFDEFGGVMRNDAGRETWEGGRDALVDYRAANEQHLGSVVVEPGAGHFAWSDRNADYLALWIRNAANARIPADPTSDPATPVKCKPVAASSGWLTDPAINKPGGPAPAPYEQYAGDKARANWHFDEALAKATVAYHHPAVGGFDKKDQFIRWKDPFSLDAGVRHFFSRIDWVEDGRSFEVHPVYADAYPTNKPGAPGPHWAQEGKPAGHTDGAIRLKAVGGPITAVGDHLLRIQYGALSPADEGGRATFLAFNPGDDQFRHAEVVGMLPRNFAGFKEGREQTITFPPISDLKPDAAPVALRAASDAGLTVDYYVAYGPAAIEDGKLRVTDLPARAKLPVEVKVVAYQFGRGAPPLVKTAKPVEQTLRIVDK